MLISVNHHFTRCHTPITNHQSPRLTDNKEYALLLQSMLKSPIKQKPLRHLGQSLNEYIANRIDDAMVWVIFTTFLILYARHQWGEFFYSSPPKPWIVTAMALTAIIVTSFKLRAEKQAIKNYRQGESGEIAVGQYLERMRSDGAQMLHDIPVRTAFAD